MENYTYYIYIKIYYLKKTRISQYIRLLLIKINNKCYNRNFNFYTRCAVSFQQFSIMIDHV